MATTNKGILSWLAPFACALLLAATGSGARAQGIVLDDESGSSFKGAQRVAIAQFGVEFYTQLAAVGQSAGNKALQVSTLTGVSDAVMQGLTDKLYADTVARLKAAGFEVVDQTELTANSTYQALVTSYAKQSPYVVHDSQGLGDGEHLSKVFSPQGLPVFYASAGSSGGYLRANLQDRLNSQNYGIGTREAEIAKKFDATLLKFSFLANYGVTKTSKNGLLANFANLAGRASLETAPTLMAYDTQVQFVNATGPRAFGNVRRSGQTGAFYLKQPLQGSNIFDAKDTTPEATKEQETATNFLLAVMGSKASKRSQTVVVTAPEQAYADAFAALLTQADEALVKALQAAK